MTCTVPFRLHLLCCVFWFCKLAKDLLIKRLLVYTKSTHTLIAMLQSFSQLWKTAITYFITFHRATFRGREGLGLSLPHLAVCLISSITFVTPLSQR